MKRHTTPIALLDARENAQTVIRIAQTLKRLTGRSQRDLVRVLLPVKVKA